LDASVLRKIGGTKRANKKHDDNREESLIETIWKCLEAPRITRRVEIRWK